MKKRIRQVNPEDDGSFSAANETLADLESEVDRYVNYLAQYNIINREEASVQQE